MKNFLVTSDGDFFYVDEVLDDILPIGNNNNVLYNGNNLFFDTHGELHIMNFYLGELDGIIDE